MSSSPEIITIINNSGKVISTGKQLVNIFKEAQAAYRERKEAVKSQRAPVQRAKTFDVTPRSGPGFEQYPIDEYTPHNPPPPSHAGYSDHRGEYTYGGDDQRDRRTTLAIRDRERRRSHEDDEDGRSNVSRQSTRSKRMSASAAPPAPKSLALTAENLKTYSEVSGTAPSKAPSAYNARSPYPDGSPRDMQLSRQTFSRELPTPPPPPPPGPGHLVRSRTEPVMKVTKKKSIDMDLAYGSIPPDLAHRHDLEPKEEVVMTNHKAASGGVGAGGAGGGGEEDIDPEEAAALTLMDKIEDFLEEAHCVHASATNMIETLQQKPEAAAAVALSLAELSTLLGKMSPAFLAFLKGGSPAVFALLASPQFLIGAGVAAGITVVMFGGWKIVKRMALGETVQPKRMMEPMAMAGRAMTMPPTEVSPAGPQKTVTQVSYEEALVLENVEELSSIESWRRGIQPGALGDEAESMVEMELISPEADRMQQQSERQKWKEFLSSMNDLPELDPSDSVSQIGVNSRSATKYKSYKSYSKTKSRLGRVEEVPERKSSRRDDERSVAGSERGGHRSERKHRDRDAETSVSHRSERRERRDRDDDVSVAGSERSVRSHRGDSRREKEDRHRDKDDVSVAGSERSTRSHRSRSHREIRERERERDRDETGSSVSRSSKYSATSKVSRIKEEEVEEEANEKGGSEIGVKSKKPNMLKQLFKRKKEKEEKDGKTLSVMI
ncbi:hypothetical protein QBC35DRAFT_220959 [Podospora australis]|uniref:Uncharacterized protein n=1 Tax=Podospora australis TaxID=1536484 RepID=A0AAN6WST6_9PEZI|nr:hypothetical protein QBC35DRAFT_220959 [Podospora australis]